MLISGQHVYVESGVYFASGVGVVIQSGAGVSIQSGATVGILVPTTVTICYSGNPLLVPNASGGINLLSGAVVSVTVKALTSNVGHVYMGGATEMPYSGQGFVLEPGEAITVDIANMGLVKVFATTSGDKVSYVGVQ